MSVAHTAKQHPADTWVPCVCVCVCVWYVCAAYWVVRKMFSTVSPGQSGEKPAPDP